MARLGFTFEFRSDTLKADVKKAINYVLGVEKFVQREYAKIDKTKIEEIVRKETLRIFKLNKIRVKAKRTISLLNNFHVTEEMKGNQKTFKISHKFLTQNRTFTHKGRSVTGRTIFNVLDYGRGYYNIPTVSKSGKISKKKARFLVWKYGNKKIVYDRIARGPIFVPSRAGLFFFEKSKAKVEEFIEAMREKVKEKTRKL